MFNACVRYSVNFGKIARLCKVEFSKAIIAEALARLLANTRGVSVLKLSFEYETAHKRELQAILQQAYS